MQLAGGEGREVLEGLIEGIADVVDDGIGVAVGAALGFADDLIDDSQLAQVLGRELEGVGRFLAMVGAAPEDRGAALGRDDRVDRVFEHQHPVGHGQRHGAAGPALADDGAHQGHPDLEAGLDGAGDRLGLSTFLGANAGIGARGVDEGHQGQPKTVRQLHQADGLAVAFRRRHAEIVGHALVGVGALFMADDHHRAATESGQAADDRLVLAEGAVTGEGGKILHQAVDIMGGVGTVGVAGNLGFLPRRQFFVGLPKLPVDLALEALDFGPDVDLAAAAQAAQLLDLGLELGDRLLEIQVAVGSHGAAYHNATSARRKSNPASGPPNQLSRPSGVFNPFGGG